MYCKVSGLKATQLDIDNKIGQSRLKMSSSQYRGGPVTTGSIVAPGMIGSASSCACSVKGAPAGSMGGTALYAIPPNYAATLPHKMTSMHQGR